VALGPKIRPAIPSPPATLGSTAAAQVCLIVWCRDCRHRVEPDPAGQAQRYGAETPVREWARRLVCSRCGGREVDFVLRGRGGEAGRRDPAHPSPLSPDPRATFPIRIE
jgi:hypothetical protein